MNPTRLKQFKATLKIRAKTLEAARSWLIEQKFVEVQGPILIPALGERQGSFQVDFFGAKAYLNSGLQPYSDVLTEALEKIYTVAPAFRAERSQSKRHLAEFWRIEIVARNFDLENIIKVQENLVEYICQILCRDVSEELCLQRGSIESLALVRAPFPQLTYAEAIERLQNVGCKIHWGEALNWKMEQKLSMMFSKPFFIREFPISGETFFHKPNPQKPELSLCADLLAPEGYGELSTGGQMITNKKTLLKKLQEINIEPADRKWYLSLKRHRNVSQSGFALGVERLIQWVSKIGDIKKTTAFPRTQDKFYP
jgi:asparaginyl-tRNA synthetase